MHARDGRARGSRAGLIDGGLWLAVVGLTAWMCVTGPLISEECYYWLYSRHLDWSYFDHPPMVGWLIAVGTRILGDGRAGIRFMTAACGIATVWVGVRWIRELGGTTRHERSWLLASLGIPALAAMHVLATPDAPLTLFYLAAAFLLWRASQHPSAPRCVAAGAASGLALLSKYTAIFLAVGLAAHMALDPPARRRVRAKHLLMGAATAAFVFSPVLLWNWKHEWVSFRFQGESRYAAARFSLVWPFVFIVCQLVIATPILPLAIWRSSKWAMRRARVGERGPVALVAYGLPLPVFIVVNSFFVQPKLHWAVAAFAPLTLLGVLWWHAEEGREHSGWFEHTTVGWIGLSWLMCIATPLARFVPPLGGVHWDPGDKVAARLTERAGQLRDEEREHTFVFTENHRDAAEITFALEREPIDPSPFAVVLAGNALGLPARQFSVWQDPERFVGWDGILVLDDSPDHPAKLKLAKEHFRSVELLDEVEFRVLGHPVRRVGLFSCRGYRGLIPRGAGTNRQESGAIPPAMQSSSSRR